MGFFIPIAAPASSPAAATRATAPGTGPSISRGSDPATTTSAPSTPRLTMLSWKVVPSSPSVPPPKPAITASKAASATRCPAPPTRRAAWASRKASARFSPCSVPQTNPAARAGRWLPSR
ncbi:MAG: hypothetical protein NVV74_09370 [Magnetospirillum sp.]|nr:hypothetical protein [Magnetospirillum sp.]